MRTYYKRYLPHLTPPGGTFFITVTLKDMLPVPVIKKLKKERNLLVAALKRKLQEQEISKTEYREALIQQYKRHFRKLDNLLDKAARLEWYLKDPALSSIVANKFKQCDGEYYKLDAYCIMSNHFHLLIDTSIQVDRLPQGISPTNENYVQLSKIMQLIKGGSSFEINKRLGRKGAFWARESYDHLVRNEKEYSNIYWYILNNPVCVGLVSDWRNWPFTYSGLVENI